MLGPSSSSSEPLFSFASVSEVNSPSSKSDFVLPLKVTDCGKCCWEGVSFAVRIKSLSFG